MKYLLDSNIVSDFYDNASPGQALIARKIAALADVDAVCISILTVYELEYGYANAPEDKKSIIK